MVKNVTTWTEKADAFYPKKDLASALLVTSGATVQCSYMKDKKLKVVLSATGTTVKIGKVSALSIADKKITPNNFGICKKLTEIAVTEWRDAGEVGDKPKDVKCVPMLKNSWENADDTTIITPRPALHMKCFLMCKQANKKGKITISSSGQGTAFKNFIHSGGVDLTLKLIDQQDNVIKGVKDFGHYFKSKGLKKGSRTVSKNALSRTAREGRIFERMGDDLLDGAESLGKSKLWKGVGLAGTVFSAVIDYDSQMEKYNDEGRALKNTVVHTAIGSTSAAIGATIGTLIPVPGLGTVVGMAAGAVIGEAANSLYDWVESGDAGKAMNQIGKQISKTANSIKAGVSDFFGKSLGSVFG